MLQQDLKAIKKFFFDLLSKNIPGNSLSWLEKNINTIHDLGSDKDLFTSFSMAPRFVGKTKIHVDKDDSNQANEIKEGFRLENLTTDQAARFLILLAAYKNDSKSFNSKTEKILEAADIHEQVAIYSFLSLLPHADSFAGKAAEGIRSNITAVFDAIALENPYPYEYLSESAWNQMVMKAIFTNRPLYRIYGFDKRRNAALANMLSDFAHERWAAGRNLTPELWRAIAPFLDAEKIKDIDRILSSENPLEVEAGCMACAESYLEGATQRLDQYQAIKNKIEAQTLTWDLLGKKLEAHSV